MTVVRDIPIARRLTLITMLTCAAALLIACGGFIATGVIDRQHLLSKIEALGVVAGALLAALGLSAWLQRALLSGARHRFAAELQLRDAELRLTKDVLEHRVQERTAELASANTALQIENVERKQAEESVRRIEQLYRQAISSADAVPYAYDYQTRKYQFMGDGIEKLTGYPAAEISPALWTGIIQESVMLGETAGLEKAEAARQVIHGQIRTWRCDMRVLTRAGATRWIADVSVQKLDAQGQALGSIGILQDITERKQAEQALRIQEERTRLIIDQAFDAVITADADFRVIGWNRQAEKAFGWQAQEIIGRSLFETVVPVHRRDKRRADLAEFRATGKWPDQNLLIESTALDRQGREVPVELTTTPIRTGNGHIFTIFLRDVTEARRAAAELGKLHQQLVEASRQAGMAEVATGVLHNVGNVLNSVNVTATLVEELVRKSHTAQIGRLAALLREHRQDLGAFVTTDPKGRVVPDFLTELAQVVAGEQQAVLQEMAGLRKNIEHIKDIVVMQQSYARVSGFIEEVDVTELVEDTLRLNEPGLSRQQVRVVREYEPLPRILTDKHKVLQILINLVRNAKNACDQSNHQERQLTLRLCHATDCIRISVIDNGVGIPPENLVRIFNHGFTTRREGHGFGLHSGALAARELGGALTAHSEGPGRGASFTLELRVRNSASTPERS